MKTLLSAALCALMVTASPAFAQDKIKYKVIGQPLAGGMIQKHREQPFFETFAAKTGLPVAFSHGEPLAIT